MKQPIPSAAMLALTLLAGTPAGAGAGAGTGEVTLIHMGDLHGHLIPRADVREAQGQTRGGLARLYTLIKDIRGREKNTLLVNGGDTVQGSAEVLYTRGKAMVDVLNRFQIDAYNPGNWDYVYGSRRFVETFAGKEPQANWHPVAANLYYVTTDGDPETFFPTQGGQRVVQPYLVRQFGDIKVGIIGLTSDRGPQTVGRTVTKGLVFSRGETELAELIPKLRKVEKVDLVVLASEMGLANNIRLAETYPGIDVVLSSDMHEETREPVVTKTGTVIVEEGQDGTMLGEIKVKIADGKMKDWHWTPHTVDGSIQEDPEIAQAVKEVRRTFVAGPDFTPHVNPFNGQTLTQPIDAVVGYTKVPLFRGSFADSDMPGVIEGSSHDFLADAFRTIAKSDVGAIRGFRYGTQVPAGPIKREDLYHYIPIGPQIGVVRIQGRWLKRQLENSADGSLNPDPALWTGGWLFGYSGLTMDLDPYQANGFRASNIQIDGKALDPKAVYSYAGYWYADDPEEINGCECPKMPGTFIRIVKGEDGSILDGVDVVVRYLDSLPDKTADPKLHRINLLKPLPKPVYGFPEVQPLRGVTPY